MRKALGLMAVVLALGLSLSLDAEARRLGGGKSGGMQRQAVTAPAQGPGGTSPSTIPGQATAPAAAGATAAAAAPKRSWMGPVAGLAAGLGLAALASHFGFGEALANMLTIALLAMGVMLVVGWLLRKRAQGPAMAGAGGMPSAHAARAEHGMFRTPVQPQGGSLIGSRVGGGATAGAGAGVGQIPAGFDVAAFVRNAKDQFRALQAANDARDVQALATFLTPEMLEVVRGEIAERGAATQATEVFGLEAQVLDVAEEADRYVVSVRFTGSVREQPGVAPEDLDETWHLTKPRHGAGGWMVAGIQQAA